MKFLSVNFKTDRGIIGFGLAVMFIYCLYNEMTDTLIYLINLLSVYDSVSMLNYDFYVGVMFIYFTVKFNSFGFVIYRNNPLFIIKVLFISQLSDVYQYLIGSNFGKYKIGWISPNKTYEGYIGGFIMTLITFIWKYSFIEITIIYILGILGGLLSSILKRKLDIKDYSNLLGTHGGWYDRIDSVILPILFLA